MKSKSAPDNNPSTTVREVPDGSNLSAKYQNLLTRYELLLEQKKLLSVHLDKMVNSKGVERKAYTRALVKAFGDFIELFNSSINYFDIVETEQTVSCEHIALNMPKKELKVDGSSYGLNLAEVKIMQRLLLAQGSIVVFSDRKFIVEEMTILKRKVSELKKYIKNANSHGMIKAYQIIF